MGFLFIDLRTTFHFTSFGFAHIPIQPGVHKIEVSTWKIAPGSIVESLHNKFNTGGFAVVKSDLVYSGNER